MNLSDDPAPRSPSAEILRALFLTALAWCGFIAALVLASPLLSGYTLAAFASVASYGAIGCLGALGAPSLSAKELGLRRFTPKLLPSLILLCPIAFITSELDNYVREFAPHIGLAISDIEMDNPDNMLTWIQMGLALVAVIPIVEEWLFRGVIQARLVGVLGPQRGVFTAAWLYGLGVGIPGAHSGDYLSALLQAFVLGAVLGWVRLRSGSLLATIFCHAGVRLLGVITLTMADEFPIAGFTTQGEHSSPGLILLSLLALGAAAALLRQTEPID